jgi:cold shock CspA family protein
MAKGKVAFFNDTGGYGFIESDDSEEDIFFHMERGGGQGSPREESPAALRTQHRRGTAVGAPVSMN